MRFDSHAKIAFIVACVTLLACSVAFQWAVHALNVYLRKEPVHLRQAFSVIPRQIGQWKMIGEEALLDEAMVEELGTKVYLTRNYAPSGDPQQGVIQVHLAYYTGMIDAVPHVPDRCFVAAGLELKTLPQNLSLPMDLERWQDDPGGMVHLRSGEVYQVVDDGNDFVRHYVLMPMGEPALRVTEFQNVEQPDVRYFSGYFFLANGRLTATPEGVRIMAFDPSEKYAYYCKAQFTSAGRGMTEERFVAQVADLLDHLLPEIMKCLPDWSEVERRDVAADGGSSNPV